MTSAASQQAQDSLNATTPNASTAAVNPSETVQAQPLSYAKTASAAASGPAGTSQNAKSESPVNGANTMAQGGPQPNGTTSQSDHGRKPSVVINASGATGQIPNGGPVNQSGRPPINFGSMGASGSPVPQPSAPAQTQASSLPAPQNNPRVISPAHSPSPIPQPAASGGRPPSGQFQQTNGMTFGSMGGDNDPMRQLGPGMAPMHERRQSSQSMHSDMSNSNRQFAPPAGAGRGRPQSQFGNMPSPGPNFRPTPAAGRGNMPPHFAAPPSPYAGKHSPAFRPASMQQPQMNYGGGYPPHVQQQMYPPFEPHGGYYQPYYGYGQYPGQPPQSPRPPYPSPYNAPQGPMQAPFHPQDMSRSASQSSQRPPSSMGQPQTPSMPAQVPQAQTPGQQQAQTAAPSSNFVKPKKSSAIKITDAAGNAVNFTKPSPSPGPQTQPQTPVIVSTPNASTPPPRAPSGHNARSESQSSGPSAEEKKAAFQEQIKKNIEAQKKAAEDEKAAKDKPEAAEPIQVKEATAEAEKAAATAAGDKKGEEAAAAAEKSMDKGESKKDEQEESEEDRIEREIAEMEAAEKEEEEREKAYQEKKRKEKEEQAKVQAEKDAKGDEELKRQEREAEEKEAEREREREAEKEKPQEPDEESKSMFASLKKPALGPGATAESPAAQETESAKADAAASMPPPQPPQTQAKPMGGAQKPKPAHLKLETSKRVEPAEPTPGMQALKTSRFLEVKEEPKYPDGFKSPNPALNLGGARKARTYDKDFLLQFQSVFKEKPSVDWDQKVKETLGPDEPASARPPASARTPSMGGRQASGRGASAAGFGGVMGQFGGPPGRTLPPGTTSQQRFEASQMGGGAPRGMAMPGQMGGRMPSNLGMGAQGMSRTNSLQTMGGMGGPNSPRQASSRGGKGASKRGMSKKEEADAAAKMPLTYGQEVTPLQKSTTGWKASSITQPAMAGPDPSGLMAPDMVQRKVKAALNKMTPEKFDRISDQILEIAAQSKQETDGRTLRQVIQLTFEKACDEAHWAGMYAQFCHKMLTTMSTDIRDETIKDRSGNPVVGGALFRKYLLNRCQEEFERGWQANLPEKPEGDTKEAALMSDEYYVAAAAKRRGLGLIQFIGQLYKLRMLTIRIMHECVMRLLNFEGDPDEAAVENLTTLLRAVGGTMDEDETGRNMMNAYFQRIEDVILKSNALGSRPKFMIMDLMDLRKTGWRSKDDAKGPKTIDQIHAEAAAAQAKADAERAKQNTRGPSGRPPAGRGDARQFSGGVPPPVDYNRTTVGIDDLRRLQNRGASGRATGGGLGPGGNLGPSSSLGSGRTGSRRGNLGPPGSGNTTRTSTPPAEKEKKEEPTQQNAFSALAGLDGSGENAEDAQSEAHSPPNARNRSRSPNAAAEKAE
ncbi:hypothetical protein NU219Hw_g3391t1 [Hortaea werneckii]